MRTETPAFDAETFEVGLSVTLPALEFARYCSQPTWSPGSSGTPAVKPACGVQVTAEAVFLTWALRTASPAAAVTLPAGLVEWGLVELAPDVPVIERVPEPVKVWTCHVFQLNVPPKVAVIVSPLTSGVVITAVKTATSWLSIGSLRCPRSV